MKFGSMVVTCEGCGCQEILQPSLNRRSFMLKFNRWQREHRMHEYRKQVGVGKRKKVSKGEQQKRALRRMSTYGVTKQ